MTQKPENETRVRLDDVRESFIGRAQEDDVNRLYLQALVAQRMPDSVASNLMLTESTERKRLFLVMHKKMMNSESAKRFEWNQADELRLNLMLDAVVNRECPDLEVVEAFKQRVCSGTKAWMATFIGDSDVGSKSDGHTSRSSIISGVEDTADTSRASIRESIVGNAGKGGLGVIVAAMQSRHHCSKWNDKDATVLLAMLECLKNIMQTKRGLRKVIKAEGSLNAIALCIDQRWTALTGCALELLSYLAWVKAQSHVLVLAALRFAAERSREMPFERVVETMDTGNLKLQAMAMELINKLLTSGKLDLEARCKLRHELELSGVSVIMRSCLVEHRKILDEDDWGSGAPDRRTSVAKRNVRNSIMSPHLKIALETTGKQYFNGLESKQVEDAQELGFLDQFKYAADGHSVIDPHQGKMAGMAIAAKNKDATSLAMMGLVGRSKTKKRWFILDSKELTWYYEDMSTRASSEASIPANEILSVSANFKENREARGSSSDSKSYGIEIIAHSRRLQMWCATELEQTNWIVALRTAQNSTFDAKYINCVQMEPLTNQGKRDCIEEFKKQSDVYINISELDRSKVLKRSLGGIDQTDLNSMSQLVVKHAHASGKSDALMTLFHHLVHFPVEDKVCWPLILKLVKRIRAGETDDDFSVKPETRAATGLETSSISGGVKAALRDELTRDFARKLKEKMLETEEIEEELKQRILELEKENEALQVSRSFTPLSEKSWLAKDQEEQRGSFVATSRRSSVTLELGALFRGSTHKSNEHPNSQLSFSFDNPFARRKKATDNEVESRTSGTEKFQKTLRLLEERANEAESSAAEAILERQTLEQKVADQERELNDLRSGKVLTAPQTAKVQFSDSDIICDGPFGPHNPITKSGEVGRYKSSLKRQKTEKSKREMELETRCDALQQELERYHNGNETLDQNDIIQKEQVGEKVFSVENEAKDGEVSGTAISEGAKNSIQDQSDSKALINDPTYAKYFKMLKMHLPRGAVEQKMRVDGLDPSILDMDPEKPLPLTSAEAENNAGVKLKDDERFAKYFKMLKMHLPRGAVEQKMRVEGLDPSILDMDPEKPLPLTSAEAENNAGVKLKDDERFAKYFKMLKMHLPRGAVEQKMRVEGLDPSILDMDPEQSFPGNAGIEDNGKEVNSSSKRRTSLQAEDIFDDEILSRIDRAPTLKLKPLYWTKVKNEMIKDSVWAGLSHSINVDFSALESKFASQSEAQGQRKQKRGTYVGGIMGTNSPMGKKGGKKISLISSKRSQNVGIILGKFNKFSHEQLRDFIINLDGPLLKVESTERISKIIPTSEEINLVNGFLGDTNMLAKVDLFFSVVSEVPRLKERIQCNLISLQFDDQHSEVRRKLHIVEQAATEVAESQWLLKMLELILVVGNYINAGSSRGRAGAFEIDNLLKLSATRSTNQEGESDTLLNFCVECMVQNYPEYKLAPRNGQPAPIFDLNKEFEHLSLASQMSFNQIASEIQHISSRLDDVSKEIKEHQAPTIANKKAGTIFVEKLTPFVQHAEASLKDLESESSRCREILTSTMRRLAQPVSSNVDDTIDILFGTLDKFRILVQQAAEQNEEGRKRLQKDMVADKHLGTRRRTLSTGSTASEGGGAQAGESDNLFLMYQHSKQATAAAIISEFKERMEKRRSNISASEDSDDD